MSRLRYKIFLLFIPLIACIFLFGHGYFVARKNLMLEHINQTSRLATAQVAVDIGYFAERRLGEFDDISVQLQQCHQIEVSVSPISVASALSYSAGFSALFVSDINGHANQFTLSANPSNRYVLRKNLDGEQLLDSYHLSLLMRSASDWKSQAPKREKQLKQLVAALSQLKLRGEENSFASRKLTRELIKLRQMKHLPKAVVTIVDDATVAKLGLIYDTSTYFFSRPLLDCQHNLIGFYTVVLDRTILEDQLFAVKQSFLKQGLHAVDVALIRNKDEHIITGYRYLDQNKLAQYKLNQSTAPVMREDLGGVLTNQTVEINPNIASSLLLDTSHSHKTGISVVLFVDQDEINRVSQTIRKEVDIYIAVSITLFILLFLFVSRYVAKPIITLRKQIRLLSTGGNPKIERTTRKDEIGELLNAFEKMTQTIRHKEQQLTKLAQYDPLTGIFNRRALMDAVRDIEALHHHTTIVFMLDLDHFKMVNDQFGHAVGDNVLRNVTALVKQDIRHSDIFGRMGGEEFTVILPETKLEKGIQIAERIRKSIEVFLGDSLPDPSSHQPLTISIGVSVWQDGSFSKALANADKYLYRAKKQGRNQVVYEGK
ncbi:diguanylate cyclase [Vibrio europaeus]|uniref:GGDEF domain-containing protein n=1 Tax=Vibrio europaeus TaxID=300876 RepID=UPI0018A7CEBF|nr:GGDEF domain-containing protein [Vibrio europaeus]MDC5811188.1 diguanylate cyclase [Vibrio europaeus]QPG34861.1 diguanylate cyclase [Vibrio europaeus]